MTSFASNSISDFMQTFIHRGGIIYKHSDNTIDRSTYLKHTKYC